MLRLEQRPAGDKMELAVRHPVRHTRTHTHTPESRTQGWVGKPGVDAEPVAHGIQ